MPPPHGAAPRAHRQLIAIIRSGRGKGMHANRDGHTSDGRAAKRGIRFAEIGCLVRRLQEMIGVKILTPQCARRRCLARDDLLAGGLRLGKVMDVIDEP